VVRAVRAQHRVDKASNKRPARGDLRENDTFRKYDDKYHVTDKLDHDTIVVTGARGEFRHLQFRVFERAVQFHKVVVHFGDGESQELALREVIRAGGRSRVIDLEGRARGIRSIDFWYDAQSIGHGKGALVKVFGQH